MLINRIWQHPHATREQLLAFQSRALCKLVAHAYDNVDFYRAHFKKAGVKPEDIQGVHDLDRIPLVTKRDLRQADPQSIFANNTVSQRHVHYRTSGSTGEPFTIYRTIRENHFLELFRKRAQWQFGVRPWHHAAAISEVSLLGNQHRISRRILDSLKIYRKSVVDCYTADDKILQKLTFLEPAIITGYPYTLAHFGESITPQQQESINPKLLICAGEPLSPSLRNRIENAFQAPLFETYGAHEFNLIAWQCLHNRCLHVCDDSVILEVLSDGQPVSEGRQGEVVVTGLFSFSMPFIRYKIGDLATRGAETCGCGQPFSTISEVVGRTADYFKFSGGQSIHPFVITGPLLTLASGWIDRYQVAHEDIDRIVLRIVPQQCPAAVQLEQIQKLGKNLLPDYVSFQVDLVDEIPDSPGGKFHTYVNHFSNKRGA